MLVVFDLDGTLVDSQRDLADAANAMLADYGRGPLTVEAIASMVGEGAAVLVRRALAASGLDPETPDALARFLDQYQLRLTVHTRPYDGIPEALDALRSRGDTLAVLTNKPQRATAAILDRLKLAPYFFEVVGGDGAAGRKPDPAGLHGIISKAHATPRSTCLVGDSPIDLETGRRAAVPVCLARYGFGFRFDAQTFRGDELFVSTPAEIPAVLAGVR